jgi:hypothetical protein
MRTNLQEKAQWAIKSRYTGDRCRALFKGFVRFMRAYGKTLILRINLQEFSEWAMGPWPPETRTRPPEAARGTQHDLLSGKGRTARPPGPDRVRTGREPDPCSRKTGPDRAGNSRFYMARTAIFIIFAVRGRFFGTLSSFYPGIPVILQP